LSELQILLFEDIGVVEDVEDIVLRRVLLLDAALLHFALFDGVVAGANRGNVVDVGACSLRASNRVIQLPEESVSNHLVYSRRDRGMSTVADIIMFFLKRMIDEIVGDMEVEVDGTLCVEGWRM
jgi:hypothetical protein